MVLIPHYLTALQVGLQRNTFRPERHRIENKATVTEFPCVGPFLALIFRTHLDSNQNSFLWKCKPCSQHSLLEGSVHILAKACDLGKGTKELAWEEKKTKKAQTNNFALKRKQEWNFWTGSFDFYMQNQTAFARSLQAGGRGNKSENHCRKISSF